MMLMFALFVAVGLAVALSIGLSIHTRLLDKKQVVTLNFLTDEIYKLAEMKNIAESKPYPKTWTEYHDNVLNSSGLDKTRCSQIVQAWKVEMKLKEAARQKELAPADAIDAIKNSGIKIGGPKFEEIKKLLNKPPAPPPPAIKAATPKQLELD